MDFETATCVLYNIKNKICTEVKVSSIQDIIDVVSLNSEKKVTQVDIDKYHKVYYDSSEETVNKGVSAWVSTNSYKDEFNYWLSCKGSEFVCGDSILLVICNDIHPINLSDKEKNYIISCIKC